MAIPDLLYARNESDSSESGTANVLLCAVGGASTPEKKLFRPRDVSHLAAFPTL